MECLPGVREVMALIPVRGLDLFFVPRLCHVDQFTFCRSLPSLKFTIFIHLLTGKLVVGSVLVLLRSIDNHSLTIKRLLRKILPTE